MSVLNKNSFSGSWVALITPMNKNGDVNFEDLRKLVNWHIKSGTTGLVILGTTAETATLSEQEQMDVLTTVIEENNGKLPIVVGNGSNSTQKTIEATKKLNQLDIQGFLTVTPYYNKPTQKGMVAHFKAVAEATDKPIILYNVPGRTCVDLSNESVIELAKIDNIVGIKDATSDLSRVEALKSNTENFLLFSGDDLSSKEYLQLGGDGVISVTANVEPKLLAQMVNRCLQGNNSEADEINNKLIPLHKELFFEPNPVPAKWALLDKGLISSDAVRLPLLTMEPNNKTVVKQALKHAQ
jgi:4-hydroxy-tetrahydrodipicolinate synthase